VKRHCNLFAAAAALVLLAACSESPLETDCCRMLTRVEMTPEVATLAVGDSVQFAATVYDEDGVAVETPVTWQVATAARGTITAAGWLRGNSAGTTYVRAVVGALRDSSLVTITP